MLTKLIKEPALDPEICIIWMHGLGADGSDMAQLASQLTVPSLAIRHVFLDAPIRSVHINQGMPMRAWYNIFDFALTNREDRKGILESQAAINEVIEEQCQEGFTPSQIFLAGFSQGGVMALFTGLHMTKPLGGIIALSSYLPLSADCNATVDKNIPIFFAYGRQDPLVLPLWSEMTLDWLNAANFSNLTRYDYPMEHQVCAEELADLSHWLRAQVKR
ncbi:MAG: carboxylesterase [Legionella sp.]|nr:carboxylesterase [Legionella sp.]